MARTSAPAMRSAVPLFSIDWLPAVCPSFGVRPVSAETIVDARERHIELLGRDLRERGHDALAELDLAGEHGDRAVGVDADPGIEHAVGLRGCRAAAPRSWPSASFGARLNDRTMPPRPAAKSRRVRERS